MQDKNGCNSISASAHFGCWNLHARSRRSGRCRIMTGRSSCWSVRSASSPGGGMATTSPATTSLPACRTKRSCGSIASGAAREDGICTAFSPEAVYSPLPAYAELHCLSNFTFLRGASHPEELVKRAAGLGYSALAITDECSLAGAVRAHVTAKEVGLPLVIGSEIRLQDGPRLVLLATDREGYGNLAALITLGRRRTKKGSYSLDWSDLDSGLPGCLVLLTFPHPCPLPKGEGEKHAPSVAKRFAGRGWIAAALSRRSVAENPRSHGARAFAHRRASLRAVFPDRPRHRPLRPQPGHSLPGARLGGQFRRLLRPGHHRGQSGQAGAVVRALH